MGNSGYLARILMIQLIIQAIMAATLLTLIFLYRDEPESFRFILSVFTSLVRVGAWFELSPWWGLGTFSIFLTAYYYFFPPGP